VHLLGPRARPAVSPISTIRPVSVTVGFVLDHISGGGAERAAVDLALNLGEGFHATFVGSRMTDEALLLPANARVVRELAAAGIDVAVGGRTSTAAAWQWAPVIGHLRREGVDIVHTIGYGSNFWGPMLRAAARARVHVAHEQTPFARIGGFRRWGTQALVNPYVVGPFADAVIVPSRWSRDILIAHERVLARKIHVVANGAPPRGTIATVDVRSQLGLGQDDEVIAIAAMLRPEKAHDVLLEAVSLLAPDRPRLKVLVLGGGPPQRPEGTRPDLERLVAARGIDDRVSFLGRREDVMAIVAAADVAVLASDGENLPLAVVEYMESGTPIVATDVGGVSELITDRVHGLVVPPRDPRAMAGAIEATLADPQAAASRATKARERRDAEYSWPHLAAQMTRIYEQLLTTPCATGRRRWPLR